MIDAAERILRRLELDIFPWLGNRAISEIKAPELLAALRCIESRGAIETGRAERDISSDLRGAVKKRHHASITDPKEIATLIHIIRSYQGSFITKCALQFALLVFVRPGELRHAEWSEINFELAEWRRANY